MKHKKTDANKARKERIINALFDNDEKSIICIQVARGILLKFQSFATLFQTNKPMCHALHFEIFKLVKTFFSAVLLILNTFLTRVLNNWEILMWMIEICS